MSTAQLPRDFDMNEVIANSFRDFHVKGFDYLCLRRSPAETVKLYFFDGDVTKLPEVVNPHDHRYAFDTYVLAGRSSNAIFEHADPGEPAETFERFEYLTPLNGGDGFRWTGQARLAHVAEVVYPPGGRYRMRADGIHTIRILENETVLMLRQFEDEVPVGVPTTTFTRHREPPSLDGLYSRFTPDQVVARLRQLEERAGIRIVPRAA